MLCQRCGSERVAYVNGKTSDMCNVRADGISVGGYVPSGLNIGDGDYLRLHFCLEWGQLQGEFPITKEDVMGILGDSEE